MTVSLTSKTLRLAAALALALGPLACGEAPDEAFETIPSWASIVAGRLIPCTLTWFPSE